MGLSRVRKNCQASEWLKLKGKMGKRKRKIPLEELREIFNATASETEPEPEAEPEENVTLSIVSMNTYLGTKKEKSALEKPWRHDLKVYPSKDFFLKAKRYDELAVTKTVRQGHKNCPNDLIYLECISVIGVYLA